jgi:hypothetical protein
MFALFLRALDIDCVLAPVLETTEQEVSGPVAQPHVASAADFPPDHFVHDPDEEEPSLQVHEEAQQQVPVQSSPAPPPTPAHTSPASTPPIITPPPIVATPDTSGHPHSHDVGPTMGVDAIAAKIETLTQHISGLTTSDREWRRDSDMQMAQLLESDIRIQRQLNEVAASTNARLNQHEHQISTLTTIVSSLQRQANHPSSHFNPPDITMPAMAPRRPSQSANASYSVEETQWLNMSGASPRPTLSASLGVLPMPMTSPISMSSAIGGSPHAARSPLLTLATVATASAMSPMQSPAAGQSQGVLFLPGVDAPTSAASDRDRTRRSVASGASIPSLTPEPLEVNRNSGKGKGKGKGKDTDTL